MADPAMIVCPALQASGGAHCWHTIWVPSSHQAGQSDSNGMRCCWCGETQPLTVSYIPLAQHGPHRPAEPRPLTTTYHEPHFGHGGIPLPDDASDMARREGGT